MTRLVESARLHVVTGPPPGGLPALRAMTLACVEAGARVIQHRDKQATDRERLETIRALVAICRPRRAAVIVNDRLDLALAAGADGVHLGTDDLDWAEARRLAPRPFVLGCTAPRVEDVRRALDAGADYVGAGPAHASRTKPTDRPPLGADDYRLLADACRAREGAPLPLVAIGGIGPGRARRLIEAGAHAVAVSGAIVNAERPDRVVRELLAEVLAARDAEEVS